MVPPQALIQVLHGEAHGQASKYGVDDPSELAIGATIRNRLNQKGFQNSSTYQGLITAGQFNGIDTSITTGTTPELGNAALLFGGGTGTSSQQSAMNVASAKCFFSPDAVGWQTLQAALNTSTVTVIPHVHSDPACFTFTDPANEQIIYKRSISNNADGRGAPAFLFEQYKAPSAPAVIDIP